MKKSILIFALASILMAGTAQAEGLKNREFLERTDAERHWYYAGAFTSIGHMVFLHDKEKAQCVWNWWPTDTAKKEALLLETFRKYPDHTPTAVILVLLKRDCGDFLKTGGN